MYLVHHGIIGQKWGIRRYQNKDGSLTKEGKAKYIKENGYYKSKINNSLINDAYAVGFVDKVTRQAQNSTNKKLKKYEAKKENKNTNKYDDKINKLQKRLNQYVKDLDTDKKILNKILSDEHLNISKRKVSNINKGKLQPYFFGGAIPGGMQGYENSQITKVLRENYRKYYED